MKNISLILIVLLLFTSPLFAQTKRSNFMYQWKNGSKYFGEWENGTMHGEGTYTFGIGKGEGDRYVGEYRNGIRSGKGIYTWSNGERYVGDFKNDDDGKVFKKGDYIKFEKGTKHSSYSKTGCTLLVILYAGTNELNG